MTALAAGRPRPGRPYLTRAAVLLAALATALGVVLAGCGDLVPMPQGAAATRHAHPAVTHAAGPSRQVPSCAVTAHPAPACAAQWGMHS